MGGLLYRPLDRDTARALSAINRRFYTERAAEFSATRNAAWAGWARLAELLETEALPDAPRVLDVGCGNARFGRYLAQIRPRLRYAGLDSSAALLAIARDTGGLGPTPDFLQVDLVDDDLAAALGTRRFDLAACFGLIHHVPGRAQRRTLLSTLLASLAPGGLLVLTCWRLARFARFRDRIVPWEAWNAHEARPIDPARLEPGDHLLAYGHEAGVRYVHFTHENETPELLAELDCETVDIWTADGQDGDKNRYFVVRPNRI